MPQQFDLIVFDWDGTLMDSTTAIVHALQNAARDIGVPVPSDEAASHIIGLGLIDALQHAMPDLPMEQYRALAERYRYHYLVRDHELRLFDGIETLLDRLRGNGHSLAVATGKTRVGLDRAMDATGLRPRFLASRCADECHSKPHPQMLEELIAEFAVEPERVLMIGDTTHDLHMALNAGVAGVGVTYGAHPREKLDTASPRFCANTVDELADWLLTHA